MGRDDIIITLLVFASILASGCVTARLLSDVKYIECGDKESYSIAMDKSISVSKACDYCFGALMQSDQQTECFKTSGSIPTLSGSKDVPSGHKYYPHLSNREEDWSVCDIDDDAAQLKCGCCLIASRDHRFEVGRGCYQLTSTGYIKGTERTADVPESAFFDQGRCKGIAVGKKLYKTTTTAGSELKRAINSDFSHIPAHVAAAQVAKYLQVDEDHHDGDHTAWSESGEYPPDGRALQAVKFIEANYDDSAMPHHMLATDLARVVQAWEESMLN